MSRTMVGFQAAGVLLLFFSLLLRSDGVSAGDGACMPHCYDQARDSALARATTAEDRSELLSLFDGVEAQISSLAGRSIWDGNDLQELKERHRAMERAWLERCLRMPGVDPGPQPYIRDLLASKPLVDMLDSLANRVGISVAAALLCDTSEDDYVRQAALRVLLARQDSLGRDLSMLCRVFLCSLGGQESVLIMGTQYWIDHDAFRLCMRRLLAAALNLPDSLAVGTSSMACLAGFEPRQWLCRLLEEGLVLEANQADVPTIERCLALSQADSLWAAREATGIKALPLRPYSHDDN